MLFEQIAKETYQLGEEMNANTAKYEATDNELKTAVENGMAGAIGAKMELDELQKKFEKELNEKAEIVFGHLTEKVELEKEKIAASKEPMTQDILAELSVLADIDLTDDEIETYKAKYKNNPLALRKLYSIIGDQGKFSHSVGPDTKEDCLENLSNFMTKELNRYRKLNIDRLVSGSAYNWLVDSAKETIDNLIKTYEEA